MAGLGFKHGSLSNPFAFRHEGRPVACAVHGGDFTSTGPTSKLNILEAEVRRKYGLKAGAGLGPGGDGDKEGTILNRVVRWCLGSVEHGADPRQAGEFIHEGGLEPAKPVVTPCLEPTT